MATVPGPRGRATFAILPQLRRDPLGLLTSLAATYGERVRIPSVTGHPVLLLSNPDDVAHVLVSNQSAYGKAPTYRPLREVLGNGLLTNEGESWARQRRLVQPMFARRNLLGFGPAMVSAATRLADSWSTRPDGTVVDVAAEMSALTLDVVGHALFSTDLSGEAGGMGPALTAVLDAYIKTVRNPLFWLIPNFEKWRTPTRRRAVWAEAHLRSVVDRIMHARSQPSDPPDLLDMLRAARDESGNPMSPQQIRDELMTFLLAGHETTANALSWALYQLSTHPDARTRLESEVDSVLAGRPPTAEDADKLEWTTAVISEAMRLYPPAWIIERQAAAPDELGEIPISPGTIVITSPYVIHRNPRYWPNPEGFDPTRFLPGTPLPHRLAYLPFGAGRRQCVGAGFANLEATLLLATLSQRVRLNLVPGTHPKPAPTVTLRPAGAIPMTLHHR
jgi:cytochrome P450